MKRNTDNERQRGKENTEGWKYINKRYKTKEQISKANKVGAIFG